MSKWIKVSERMPGPHERIIVFVPFLTSKDSDGIRAGHWIPGLKEWRVSGSPSSWEVTHWMWHRGEWIDMTPLPLIWFANKATRVVKVSRVKCGAGHHYRRTQ